MEEVFLVVLFLDLFLNMAVCAGAASGRSWSTVGQNEPPRSKKGDFTPRTDFEKFSLMYRFTFPESNPLLFVIF